MKSWAALFAVLAAGAFVAVAAAPGRAMEKSALREEIAEASSYTFTSARTTERAARYFVAKDTVAFLKQYDWFSLWYRTSGEFKERVDNLLEGASVHEEEGDDEALYHAYFAVSDLPLGDWGTVYVSSPYDDASLYLNGIFIDSSYIHRLSYQPWSPM